MRKIILKLCLIIASLQFNISCTNPYTLQNENFEDLIVIEATITNEPVKQVIKISRTTPLESDTPKFEKGAIVFVTDDLGNRYNFIENDNAYESEFVFQALPGRTYQLFIRTINGRSYQSTIEKLTSEVAIEDLEVNKTTSNGINGVQIRVKSFDPSTQSKYFRYSYEETSRITAPKWVPDELKLVDFPRLCSYFPGFVGYQSIEVIPKINDNTKICYKTQQSNNILITSTTTQTNNRVDFPVRFISSQDYTIGERYSILVKQFSLNNISYHFYDLLLKNSSSNSILSQMQPGFIYGNISSNTNSDEKVLGLFEVCSVNTKRIFFNYDDIYPGTAKPPYFINCDGIDYDGLSFDFRDNPRELGTNDTSVICSPPPSNGFGPGVDLRRAIERKTLLFYREILPFYNMVEPMCGDCTTIGSNIKPSFWID